MDPMGDSTSNANTPVSRATPPAATNTDSSTPPHVASSAPAVPNTSDTPSIFLEDFNNAEYVGSPLKKARPSVSMTDEDGLRRRLGSNLAHNILSGSGSGDKEAETAGSSTLGSTGSHFGAGLNSIAPPAPPATAAAAVVATHQAPEYEDEEL